MDASVWTVIISACALIASVFSPIITTIINNRYQMKVNNRKYFEEYRAGVIENYIHYAGSFTARPNGEDLENYGKYSKEIYLYLPENLWNNVDCINEAILKHNYDTVSEQLAILCKDLNKHPPRLETYKRGYKNK